MSHNGNSDHSFYGQIYVKDMNMYISHGRGQFFQRVCQESSVIERFLIKEHNDERHYSYNLPVDLGTLLKFLVDDNKFSTNFDSVSFQAMYTSNEGSDDTFRIFKQKGGDAIHKITVPCLPGEDKIKQVKLIERRLLPKDKENYI